MTTAKRKRGRPKMAPGAVKNYTFSIRLTPDERALVEAAAERAGATSASDWARDVIVKAAARSRTSVTRRQNPKA